MKFTTPSIVASVSLLASMVNAFGQVAQVVDATNFCVFLPPTDSADRNIADTEWNAQAFCMGNTPKATNAGKIPAGFIQSAHFVATDKYVQVTGQIDPTKANLDVNDDGGQYDIKAPDGSSCAGWKYYVNLIEPTGRTYCMRCCNDDRTCNRGISEKGCAHIIPGDYSGPLDNGGAAIPPPAPSPSATKSATKAAGTPVAPTTPPATAVPSTKASSSSSSSASSSPLVPVPSGDNVVPPNSSSSTSNTKNDTMPGTGAPKGDPAVDQPVSAQSFDNAADARYPAVIFSLAIAMLSVTFTLQ